MTMTMTGHPWYSHDAKRALHHHRRGPGPSGTPDLATRVLFLILAETLWGIHDLMPISQMRRPKLRSELG